jgi:hypothetical protein
MAPAKHFSMALPVLSAITQSLFAHSFVRMTSAARLGASQPSLGGFGTRPSSISSLMLFFLTIKIDMLLMRLPMGKFRVHRTKTHPQISSGRITRSGDRITANHLRSPQSVHPSETCAIEQTMIQNSLPHGVLSDLVTDFMNLSIKVPKGQLQAASRRCVHPRRCFLHGRRFMVSV